MWVEGKGKVKGKCARVESPCSHEDTSFLALRRSFFRVFGFFSLAPSRVSTSDDARFRLFLGAKSRIGEISIRLVCIPSSFLFLIRQAARFARNFAELGLPFRPSVRHGFES